MPALSDIKLARAEFYERLSNERLAPLWEVLSALVTPTPRTPAVAASWSFLQIRPLLMEAGELITAAEAERRVLILENPALPGQSRITQTLYAGLQLILPGEVAPAHRHIQNALRFIMDGDGAFTALDGERAYMHKYDLILTPALCWHDNGNETNIARITGLGPRHGRAVMRRCGGAAISNLRVMGAARARAIRCSSTPTSNGVKRWRSCGGAKRRIPMTAI